MPAALLAPRPARRPAPGVKARRVRAHLAVVAPCYLPLILSGEKAIESRFTRTRREPFGRVRTGDVVYFKSPGQSVSCRAHVGSVREFESLSPAMIRTLERTFGAGVMAPHSYWHARSSARYLTLLWLVDPRPVSRGPRAPHLFGRGWLTLGAARGR